MQKHILFIAAIFTAATAGAQNISVKKDTVYAGHEHVALFKKTPRPPFGYFITSLTGNDLITFHYSHVQEKGKPGYVITFVKDGKQGILAQQPGFPASMIAELFKCHLINKGTVDEKYEAEFLARHPLPKGYTDTDQLIEY